MMKTVLKFEIQMVYWFSVKSDHFRLKLRVSPCSEMELLDLTKINKKIKRNENLSQTMVFHTDIYGCVSFQIDAYISMLVGNFFFIKFHRICIHYFDMVHSAFYNIMFFGCDD